MLKDKNNFVGPRNVSIALAILIVAVAYGVRTIQETIYYNKLDNARESCGRENGNSWNFVGYTTCMRYHGFDNDLKINRDLSDPY